MEPSLAVFQAIGARLIVILVLVLLDTVGGIALALKAKKFEWKKVGNFLGVYGAKILGLLMFEAMALLPQQVRILSGIADGAAYAVYAALLLSTVASVSVKAKELGASK